jgi:hypothetical protein
VIPISKIGAVESYSIPTRDINKIALRRSYDNYKKKGIQFIDNITPESYYLNREIPGGEIDMVVQTGVFVCSPKYHKEIFERIYNNYEDKHGSEYNYEMPAMSYELVKNDIVHWISPSFNFCVDAILSAFYPDNLYKEDSKRGSFIKKIINKIINKFNLNLEPKPDNIFDNILDNIYSLSIFMHFAGCSELMSKMKANKNLRMS